MIVLTFTGTWKCVLSNNIKILVISATMATPGFLTLRCFVIKVMTS